jgi:hypothetical protein
MRGSVGLAIGSERVVELHLRFAILPANPGRGPRKTTPTGVDSTLRSALDTKEVNMRKPQLLIAVAVAVASLAIAPAATAAVAEPGTFAAARRGSLLVVSSALVGNRNAEMMGGWNNTNVACSAFRRLTVKILIDRVRSGTTNRIERKKSGLVQNCAEGGPNFGFFIRASNVGLACPDRTWRPGRYDFVTNTFHRPSRLRAIASLFFRITDPC